MSDDSGVASGNENESDDIIFMNEDNNNNNNVDPVANIEVHIINNDNVENIVQDEPQAVDANDSRMNVDIVSLLVVWFFSKLINLIEIF